MVYWDTSPDPGYQGGSGVWSSSGYWNNNGVRGGWFNSNQDTAVFSGTPGATVQIQSAATTAAIHAEVGGYTLGAVNGSILTISTGSVVTNANLTILAPISAPVGLFKSGDAVLTLGATNTISGAITLLGGTLSFAGEANLGAVGNDIQLSGGTLRYAGGAQLSLNSGRTVFVNAAGGGLETTGGLLLLAANGQLTGMGTLVKQGTATMRVSGSNVTFAGAVDVAGGTLQLENPLAVNGRPIRLLSGSRLALRSNAAANFISAVTVAGDATVDVDQLNVTLIGATHRVGDLAIEPGATLTARGFGQNYLTVKNLSIAGTLRIASESGVGVGGAMSGSGGVTFESTTQFPELFKFGLLFADGAARTISNPFNADASGSGRPTVGVGGAGTVLTYDGAWDGGTGGAGVTNYVVLRDGGTFVAGPNAHLNTTTANLAGARPFTVIGNGTNNTFELGQAFVADRTAGGTVADGFASLEVRDATVVTRSTLSLPVVRRQDGFGGTHRAGVITLSGTAGARWVATASPQVYDGRVSIEGPAVIVTEQGLSHAGVTSSRFDGQFQIPVGGLTLVKEGKATLTLAGAQGYAPGAGMRVAEGAVRFETDPGAGWYEGNFTRGVDGNVMLAPVAVGTLAAVVGGPGTAEGGAVVDFAAPVSRVASLTVGAGGTARVVASPVAGARTLVMHDLSVTAGGRLDVQNNRLVVDYDALSSPLSSIVSLIKSGSVVGAPDPAMGVGYAEAADVLRLSGDQTGNFGGAAVDATSVLVRFTLLGDANLDGRVDFADFQRLERGFGRAGQSWSGGDFDYDGVVGRSDFMLLYANYHRGLDGAGAAAVEVMAASVPEPAGAAVVGCFATCITILASRREKRHVKIENL